MGKDVLTSFHEAAQKTKLFTSTDMGTPNGPFPDDAVQHPLLDDNDDGFGSHSPGGDSDRDGYLSRKMKNNLNIYPREVNMRLFMSVSIFFFLLFLPLDVESGSILFHNRDTNNSFGRKFHTDIDVYYNH